MNFKNLGFWDIGLVKLSVLSATLFLVSVWDGLAVWAMKTHWAWFLVIALLLAIKPMMVVFKK
jgi:hypothetical protein